jgi:hypothetical protein
VRVLGSLGLLSRRFKDQPRDSSGWEIKERWLDFISIVLATVRLGMKVRIDRAVFRQPAAVISR